MNLIALKNNRRNCNGCVVEFLKFIFFAMSFYVFDTIIKLLCFCCGLKKIDRHNRVENYVITWVYKIVVIFQDIKNASLKYVCRRID